MRAPHDPPEWVTELIWRLVSWLDADLRSVAEAELRAEGLVPREPPVAVESPPIKVSAALRSRTTVLDCDAVLADGRPDWQELAAEHRREPFGRVQRRALIARRDCPDELTRALLTPWDSLVAVRLGDRGQPIPRWVWEPALARIGETRRTFVRQAVSEEAVREQILATSRLDLFVRAVADVDTPKTAVLWKGVGGLLRLSLGDDRAAWLTAAAVLTAHKGTFESLLHRVEQTPVAPSPQDADLRILVHAPDALLAEVISELSDEALERMGERDRGPGHVPNSHLSSMIVNRIFEAGIPPRGVFARWANAAFHDTPEIRLWAHGFDPDLDGFTEYSARHDVALRRVLASRLPPPGPVTDLAAALRACAVPSECEAVLLAVAGEDGPLPWPGLVDAHRDAPLPTHVLCSLAAREGFPEPLARSLPRDDLYWLAAQSPAAARAAVAAGLACHYPWNVIPSIREAGVLADEELAATFRPAMGLVQHVVGLAEDDGLRVACALTVERAAREAPAGFWPAVLRKLLSFKGTLPELLAHPD